MLKTYTLKTEGENFYNITRLVNEAINESGISEGICVVYCPHTTAGITINENADPNVVKDMIYGLDKSFPDCPQFRHIEGNSAAHLKASFIGSSATVIVEKGKPVLGIWQGIYFCEFDGPRTRKIYVTIQ